jgi:[pyruvate, water dikinase]-phosphate phosphotransferase / [pyruvate, water dikinase] kinase
LAREVYFVRSAPVTSIFVVSDGTGETASTMIKAALVQYPARDIIVVRYKNVRSEEQVEAVIADAYEKKGVLVYTVVSFQLRQKIRELSTTKGLQAVDLLGPLLNALDLSFGGDSQAHRAGLLRTVDDQYFRRIEAIEYTVKHDDGKSFAALQEADIILVGISRTSKTPLSIFLSHKGWKVANIPIVLGQSLPENLFKVDQRKIIGLVIDPENLHRIRRRRLEKFRQDPGGEYASREHIQMEIDYSLELFKQHKRWPVFNITDRALEETSGEIIRIVATRMDLPYDKLL